MEFSIDLVGERSVLRESIKGVIWTIFFNRLFGPIQPQTSEFLNITYPQVANQPELDAMIDDKINRYIRSCVNARKLPVHGVMSIQFLDQVPKKRKASTNTATTTTTTRKSSGWFSRGSGSGGSGGSGGGGAEAGNEAIDEENVRVWETWTLNIECLPIEERITNRRRETHGARGYNHSHAVEVSMQNFEMNLLRIYDAVERERDHVPPITTLEVAPFAYRINILPSPSSPATLTPPPPPSAGEEEGWGTYIKKILD
ncbi:uncharacterized protein LODBEIA_P04510 [Lodderomyces beijingensis]|uniref:Autophagy-related protein 101 n=1 Tax=Lodderomyces beijingensis TaxID=1775926 RepID=A0ABP0ZJ69_9ASCO